VKKTVSRIAVSGIVVGFALYLGIAYRGRDKATAPLEEKQSSRPNTRFEAKAVAPANSKPAPVGDVPLPKGISSQEEVENELYELSAQLRDEVEADKLDNAALIARKLLKRASCCKSNWNYGNILHRAHIALGRFFLLSGDLNSSITELLEAGRTPGSPQLNSFGPDWMLANELLRQGKRQAVLEYIRLCGRFWKEDGTEKPRRELTYWEDEIRNGKNPDLTAYVFFD